MALLEDWVTVLGPMAHKFFLLLHVCHDNVELVLLKPVCHYSPSNPSKRAPSTGGCMCVCVWACGCACERASMDTHTHIFCACVFSVLYFATFLFSRTHHVVQSQTCKTVVPNLFRPWPPKIIIFELGTHQFVWVCSKDKKKYQIYKLCECCEPVDCLFSQSLPISYIIWQYGQYFSVVHWLLLIQ